MSELRDCSEFCEYYKENNKCHGCVRESTKNNKMTEDKEIIIDGVDVNNGNKKYAEKYSPVNDWYKSEYNTIDGINVAECVHFTRQVDYGYCELSNDSCNEFQYNCVKNVNCYYKQLKRLEQENKAYKSSIIANHDRAIGKRLEEVLEENEELKKENKEINIRMSDVIYRATGGRLCYSTYTLDAIEQAFQDQLEILSDRKAEELEQENKELRKLRDGFWSQHEVIEKLQQEKEELKETTDNLLQVQYTLAESCNKYSKALEEISEILKGNKDGDIDEIIDKINEVLNE